MYYVSSIVLALYIQYLTKIFYEREILNSQFINKETKTGIMYWPKIKHTTWETFKPMLVSLLLSYPGENNVAYSG